MKKIMPPSRLMLSVLLAASAMIGVKEIFAQVQSQSQSQSQAQKQIYGSQLMTDSERAEYQAKMRTLKTSKDRDAFRLDHHEKMKVRAAEKGITLPNSPPNRRSVPRTNADRGVDPNSGMGTGQGSPAGGGKGSNR